MNRDDLVERVALGLYQHKFSDINSGQTARMWDMMTEVARNRYRGYARAALAIIEPAVRGECARVADDYEPETVVGDGGKLEDESVYSAASAIAAAIRAGAKP